VIDALGRELPSRQTAVTAISLVSQAPEQLWTCDLVTQVPFGTGLPTRPKAVDAPRVPPVIAGFRGWECS
jgi:hypothetical protein